MFVTSIKSTICSKNQATTQKIVRYNYYSRVASYVNRVKYINILYSDYEVGIMFETIISIVVTLLV